MGKLVNFCAGADWKKRPDNVKAILINVPEHGSSKRRIEKVRLLREETNPMYWMGDSGGFELLKAETKGWKITHDPDRPLIYKSPKEINLAPKHVMEFASILDADMVIALDFPVGKPKTPAEREIEFYKKLPLNVRWAHESATWKKRLCAQAQLFQPIQAYNLGHLDAFFFQTAGIPYDGVAMPIREAKFHEIALFLTSFYQRGINQVHLLGTASFQKIAMVSFMAHNLFDWMSLDATTWNTAAFHGGYLNQKNLSYRDLRPKVKLDPGIANDCPCPYCKSCSFTKIQGLPNKKKFELLRQHNWWAIDKAVADLWANSANLIQLEQFLQDRDVKAADIDNLINTLALVDCLKDDDIEVLQTILAPVPKKRKPTLRRRKQTSPASQWQNPTRISEKSTNVACRPTSDSNRPIRPEQIKKVLQED